jgi:sugar/nucleoside kinase (ribokinase family)
LRLGFIRVVELQKPSFFYDEIRQKLEEAKPVIILPDYFVDRFVRISNLKELYMGMKATTARGGGSLRISQQSETKGGNAVNLGFALAALGARVGVFAICSGVAEFFLRSMSSPVENLELTTIKGKPGYTVAFEFQDKGKHVNVMLSDVGDLKYFGGEILTEEHWQKISKGSILAVVNYGANLHGNSLVERCFGFAKNHQMKTFFDPADISGREEDLVSLKKTVFDKALADFVSLNDNETRVLCSALGFRNALPNNFDSSDIKRCAVLLSQITGGWVDIHTRLASCSAFGKEAYAARCKKVNQKTVTGAGDVWAAADICGYLSNLNPEVRLNFANAAGGIYVSQENAEAPDLKDVLDYLEQVTLTEPTIEVQ